MTKDLRQLDLDDLYLLELFQNGATVSAAAKDLNLTQPAASQRIKKIEQAFQCKLFERQGRYLKLTKVGRSLCANAVDALSLLSSVAPKAKEKIINIGTRPEVGRTWLWPALAQLKMSHPQHTFHIYFGSGEEILRDLGQGQIDVALTSAPHTSKLFGAIEVAKEDYSFVACPQDANTIKTHKDLEQHLLIEHDRSFPFTNYLSAKDKIKIKYRDVWFIQSSQLMVDAILRGLGVGIVPHYLAEPYIKNGDLQPLKLKLSIDSDYFRLVYRLDRNIAAEIDLLASLLKQIGLR